jgi:hypothetical protein
MLFKTSNVVLFYVSFIDLLKSLKLTIQLVWDDFKMTRTTSQNSQINLNLKNLRFKKQFKQLNFYSIPDSTLFVVRKRLNLIIYFFYLVVICLYSLL